jgi:hypothetical protein
LEAYIALKDVVNITVFGASSIRDHGEYVFENYIPNLPFINDDIFLSKFIDIIKLYNIDVVIPTHDDVVLKLAEHQNEIPAKLLVHGLEQAKICRSKKLTYELFKAESFCPEIYPNLENFNKEKLPLFCKPDKGQGGKGAFILDYENYNSITNLSLTDYVITEYLPGEELTVDCFTDYKGDLKFIGPRERVRVSNGISVRTRTTKLTKEIKLIARKISTTLNLNGLWYFQLKKNRHSEWRLLEVSLRIAGSMNLYRVKGVNFPLLAVYNALEYQVTPVFNNFEVEVDRALFNRYKHNIEYEHVYIDFDDTITKGELVNPEVMLFIYYIKNNGKKLHLITKHKHNIFATLSKLRIHANLFDTIIHLQESDEKSDYIEHKKHSVFIDNSFNERYKIQKN